VVEYFGDLSVSSMKRARNRTILLPDHDEGVNKQREEIIKNHHQDK
jgi:hypothetical protein